MSSSNSQLVGEPLRHGVNLFGTIEGPFIYGAALSKYSNFRDFPRAFTALFVTYTGNWMSYFSEIFRDVRCDWEYAPPLLPDGSAVNCDRVFTSVPFYVTFVVVAIFLLANLFVAVVLERFGACADVEAGLFRPSAVSLRIRATRLFVYICSLDSYERLAEVGAKHPFFFFFFFFFCNRW